MYAWMIYKDHLEGREVSVVGPSSTTMTAAEIRKKGDFFTLHDDDDVKYFSGYLYGEDATGDEPLDDYGQAFGCTNIKMRYKPTGKMEYLF